MKNTLKTIWKLIVSKNYDIDEKTKYIIKSSDQLSISNIQTRIINF